MDGLGTPVGQGLGVGQDLGETDDRAATLRAAGSIARSQIDHIEVTDPDGDGAGDLRLPVRLTPVLPGHTVAAHPTTRTSVRQARLLCRAFEGIHAPAYFDPEVLAAWKDVGLKGYWMGYFASRAAPMGAVEAAVVEATFPSFDVERIRRAIPDAWSFATPAEILEARDAAVGRALSEAWGDIDVDVVADVAGRARDFARGIDVVGARASLPLFAANAARAWPDGPMLTIFHASTLVREYRGDRHLALLASMSLDGIAANVLAGATPAYDRDWVRESRGWGDEVWQGAVDALVERGWITPDEQFTDTGRAMRSEVERRTDALVAAPVTSFGVDEAERLTVDLEPFVAGTVARLPESAPQRGGSNG